MKYFFFLLIINFLSNYCFCQIRADFTPHENYNIYDIAIDESGFLHAVEKNDENLVYTVFDSMFNIVRDPLIFPNTSNASRPQIDLSLNDVVVVWRQIAMNWNSYIYGHLFHLWSDTIGSFFQINDVYFDAERSSPDVCFLNDTVFVTVWSGDGPQTPSPATGIYGQKTTIFLTSIGNNQLLSDTFNEDTEHVFSQVLFIPNNQSYLVIWRDNRSGINKIYGRIFNDENIPQDSSFIISEDSAISNLWFFDTAITSDGNFVVVWGAEVENKWQIEWRWFMRDGESLGPSEFITSASDSVLTYAAVSVALDKNNQGVIVWEERLNGYSRIHGQRFSPDHNLFGNTFQISAVLDTFSQYLPLVKINNDKIYSLWFEGEKTKANIIDFNSPPVTIFINENSNKINKCYLSDNYPNPFNSVSMIEFKVSKQSNVRLVVFDNLGRKINTIFDQPVDPRKLYRVTWDGKNSHGIDVSSGVYYYKLISDSYTKTKKLVLVR